MVTARVSEKSPGLFSTIVLFGIGVFASLLMVVGVVIPLEAQSHTCCRGATLSSRAAVSERQACLELGITPEEYRALQLLEAAE